MLPIDSLMKIKIIEYDADFIAFSGIMEIYICTIHAIRKYIVKIELVIENYVWN